MTLAEDLASELRKLDTKARILTFDIETQRAIVETFNLFPKYIHIDRVLIPSRILCFSARWHGEDKDIFKSAWTDPVTLSGTNAKAQTAYEKMMRSIWQLLNEADIVVTWNGDRFDIQWVEAECARLGMGRPTPYKDVDLIKILKRRFKAGLMSMKLQWSARYWLYDEKVPHEGRDLWHDLRHGTAAEKRNAQDLMCTYCIHDTALTERMFDEYLPWIGVNLGLYRDDPDEEFLRCTKCGAHGHLKREKKPFVTGAFTYQMYRCRNVVTSDGKLCGGISRGKRSKVTTELRTV